MNSPIRVREIENRPVAYVDREYTYEDLLELFPDGGTDVVNPLVRRCQEYECRIAELEAEAERLRELLAAAEDDVDRLGQSESAKGWR